MTPRDYARWGRQIAAILGTRRKTDEGFIRDWQGRMLRSLVRAAYTNVPLYRRKYDEAGLRPEEIRSLDDLTRLPLLTKRELAQSPPGDILDASLSSRRVRPVKTSGSTGVPLMVFKDRALLARHALLKIALPMALNLRWNRPRFPRILAVFAVDHESIELAITESSPGFLRLLPGIWSFIDARTNPAEILAALNRTRPDIVFSYPSVLMLLTEEVLKRSGSPPPHQPAAWAVSAEPLTSEIRKTAGEVFAGEIFDIYASVEAVSIAIECGSHKGLHVQANEVILEILRDGRPAPPGSEGDVVVTDLWNRSTPIIRYAGLGDRAAFAPEPCPCGNHWPRLARIKGRRPETFRLPDGRTVHPYSLTLALEAIDGIAAFQVIQDARDKVRILIVPGRGAATGPGREALKEKAAAALAAILGPAVGLSVEAVSEIPGARDPSFRVVRSLVI